MSHMAAIKHSAEVDRMAIVLGVAVVIFNEKQSKKENKQCRFSDFIMPLKQEALLSFYLKALDRAFGLCFVLFEVGSHYIAQAGHRLLGSSGPPTPTSRVAGTQVCTTTLVLWKYQHMCAHIRVCTHTHVHIYTYYCHCHHSSEKNTIVLIILKLLKPRQDSIAQKAIGY